MLDLAVVVPTRNAESLLDDCLASVVRSTPAEVIVVDGLSSDASLCIARRYTDRLLSDEGAGLPAARIIGAESAGTKWVALVDADVVLPEGTLERLLEEFVEGGYTALQAGLESVGRGDYWSEALANHHRSGRSKNWFGLVATIFERDVLLEHGFDSRFASGEDIELRWRLQASGAKVGVSRRTVVTHRFEGGFAFARGQWRADGKGLARMVEKHPRRGLLLLALPLAGGGRGIVLSIVRGEPQWVPYYLCYTGFNYVAMCRHLLGTLLRRPRSAMPAPGG